MSVDFNRQKIVAQQNHELVLAAAMEALRSLIRFRTVRNRGDRRIAQRLGASEVFLGGDGRRRIARKRLVFTHHRVAAILLNREDSFFEDDRNFLPIELPLRPANDLRDHEEVIDHLNTDRAAEIGRAAQVDLLRPKGIALHLRLKAQITRLHPLLQARQCPALRHGRQDQGLVPRLKRTFHEFPRRPALLRPFHKGKIVIRIVFDAHEQVIDRPIRLRLHTREIIQTAPALIEHEPLTVKIHWKEVTYPAFIDRADQRMIAEPPRICVHQDVRLRHIAEFLLIDVAQTHIVVADTLLHMTLALHGNIILIPDVVHQIVVVASPEIGAYHIKAQRVDLTDEIVVPVKDVDVFQTVSVRPHLPEGRLLHLMKIPRTEKFRILMGKLLRIGHHRRFEVQILHDLLRKDRRIPPPILKHQIKGARRQRFFLAVVVEDVLLCDGHIALIVQLRQLAAQLLLADQRARVADAVNTEIRERNKAAILRTDRGIIKCHIGLERKEETQKDGECHKQNDKLHNDTRHFPAVLPPRKFLKTDLNRRALRRIPPAHPVSPTST